MVILWFLSEKLSFTFFASFLFTYTDSRGFWLCKILLVPWIVSLRWANRSHSSELRSEIHWTYLLIRDNKSCTRCKLRRLLGSQWCRLLSLIDKIWMHPAICKVVIVMGSAYEKSLVVNHDLSWADRLTIQTRKGWLLSHLIIFLHRRFPSNGAWWSWQQGALSSAKRADKLIIAPCRRKLWHRWHVSWRLSYRYASSFCDSCFIALKSILEWWLKW